MLVEFVRRNGQAGMPVLLMLRAIAIVLGIVLAAAGGVIAYRAFFLEPAAAVIISEKGIRELPDTARVVGGIVLLLGGAALAFFAGVKMNRTR